LSSASVQIRKCQRHCYLPAVPATALPLSGARRRAPFPSSWSTPSPPSSCPPSRLPSGGRPASATRA
jgi:hypothetical protein